MKMSLPGPLGLRSRAERRRGSVFILVVAVLSVLVMLTLTLSYVSQMDLLAAGNWGKLMQARMAAVTGLPQVQGAAALTMTGAMPAKPGSAAGAPAAAMQAAAREASAQPMMARQRRGGVGMVRTGGPGPRMRGEGNPERAGMGPETAGTAQPAMMAAGSLADESLEPVKLRLEIEGGQLAAESMSARSRVARVNGRGGSRAVMAAGRGAGRTMAPGAGGREVASLDEAGERAAKDATSGLATALIEDESAKININAIVPDLAGKQTGSESRAIATVAAGGTVRKITDAPGAVTEKELAGLIEAVAASARIAGVNAQLLAHQIALRRYGPDGRPGRAYADDNANNGRTDALKDQVDNDRDGLVDESDEALIATAHDGLDNNRNGIIDEAGESVAQDGLDNNGTGQADEANEAVDDPDEACADPRRPVIGDDRPYASLKELMAIPGMTPALYRALTPYLTTFSVSFAAFEVEEDARRGGGRPGETLSSMPRQERRGGMGAARGGRTAGSERQGRGAEAGGRDEAADTGYPQIDPNTAGAELIYQVLKIRFPEACDELLGQFTANMIDRRDIDDLPTAVQIGDKTYWGMEINPCLSEVCPDPAYGDNKDGQFIEIANPWSKSITLNGWSVRGTGVQAELTGALPAGGFLVLTNDANNESDKSPEDDGSEGSFYNVFKLVGTGAGHQLVEVPGMQLNAKAGKLQLVNPEGRVVDEFEYAGGENKGAAKSFQRSDPRLRAAELKPPTPLAPNSGSGATADSRSELARSIKMMEQWQNQPFRSPLDVMLVSSLFVAEGRGRHGAPVTASMQDVIDPAAPEPADAAAPLDGIPAADEMSGSPLGRPEGSHGSTLPLLNGTGPDSLDARLVDCFRIGAVIPPEQSVEVADLIGTTDNGRPEEQADRLAALQLRKMAKGREIASEAELPEAPRCMPTFGRINLNTAPPAVLAALPGMKQDLVKRIVAQRAVAAETGARQMALRGVENGRMRAGAVPAASQAATAAAIAAAQTNTNDWSWWMAESPFRAPRWKNLSDFIRDETIWEGRPLYDRLDAVYPYCQMVAMNTLAIRVLTTSVAGEGAPVAARPGQAARPARRSSEARAERIIAGDRGCAETVRFGYLNNISDKQAEPDLRYALPAGRVTLVTAETVAREIDALNKRAGKVTGARKAAIAAGGASRAGAAAIGAVRNAGAVARESAAGTAGRGAARGTGRTAGRAASGR